MQVQSMVQVSQVGWMQTTSYHGLQKLFLPAVSHLWQGPHGRAVAQPLKERVRLDYRLSTTRAQLMSVQGYNTFIHTRLLGNK